MNQDRNVGAVVRFESSKECWTEMFATVDEARARAESALSNGGTAQRATIFAPLERLERSATIRRTHLSPRSEDGTSPTTKIASDSQASRPGTSEAGTK